MDGKYVERLILAAEVCKPRRTCEVCEFDVDCPIIDIIRTDEECTSVAEAIVYIHTYYESLIASERANVIAEIREYVVNHAPYIYPTHILAKFNSMEPDKGDKSK